MKNTIRLKDKNGIWQEIAYETVQSRRTTCSIALKEDGSLQLRVPMGMDDRAVRQLLTKKQAWITGKRSEQKLRQKAVPQVHYTEAERIALESRYRKAAQEYIPKRAAFYVSHFADIIDGSYERIQIRSQKTRWGSCSSRGTLSFNWRLMLAPPAVLDYVVVHELCHLRHMNHSPQFWQCVEQILPDYKLRREWLRDHGNELTLS